nr:SigF/SigG family RNA polymerase sporulation sigma factor [uncultured Blautia sp.]
MDHTLALIGRIHQGDKEARDTLFAENIGLVYSVTRRFLGRGVELEDLFQIGSIGLLKAIDNFNPDFQVKFSTYAVPMIIGEIKRFLRDDGILKVSRSIKENQYKVCKIREEMEHRLGREPDMRELSEALHIPVEELAMTMEAASEVESIYRTVYQGDGTELQLVDRLPEKENQQEKLLDRIFLDELLEKLEGEERKLIVFRYFQDMTQTEVAKRLGISQVQVSRMEKKILKKMLHFSSGYAILTSVEKPIKIRS